MRPHPVRAVIFDCDGTLVDSEVPGMDVLHQLACAQGLALTREDAHRRFRGVRMADIVRWITTQLPPQDADFEAHFTRRVRAEMAARFARGLSAMPGAHALLHGLRIPRCVATNGPREKVEQTLGLTGLRPYFGDHVYTAYEVGSFKPDPGLFLHAATAMACAPAACAVVEDSEAGLQAGIAAGMQVFALMEPQAVPQALVGRVVRIDSLADLPALWARAGGATGTGPTSS